MTIQSILVPLDSSPAGQVVTQSAIALAQNFHAKLTGLFVLDQKVLEAPYLADLQGIMGATPWLGFLTQIREGLEKLGDQTLEKFQAACQEAGLENVEIHKEKGLIHNVIGNHSMSHDLVVLGRNGENAAWSGETLGASVEPVIRQIKTPALLAGGEFHQLRRFLIAYDGSALSNSALRVAISWMENQADASCKIVACATRQEDGAPLLEDARNLLQAHQIPFEAQVLEGDPREKILQAAREFEADVLVMGAFGHSRLHGLFLGSTTTYLMSAWEKPLLLTHAG